MLTEPAGSGVSRVAAVRASSVWSPVSGEERTWSSYPVVHWPQSGVSEFQLSWQKARAAGTDSVEANGHPRFLGCKITEKP